MSSTPKSPASSNGRVLTRSNARFSPRRSSRQNDFVLRCADVKPVDSPFGASAFFESRIWWRNPSRRSAVKPGDYRTLHSSLPNFDCLAKLHRRRRQLHHRRQRLLEKEKITTSTKAAATTPATNSLPEGHRRVPPERRKTSRPFREYLKG